MSEKKRSIADYFVPSKKFKEDTSEVPSTSSGVTVNTSAGVVESGTVSDECRSYDASAREITLAERDSTQK
jgi:hypothetical protein